jgi:hypothetical protein
MRKQLILLAVCLCFIASNRPQAVPGTQSKPSLDHQLLKEARLAWPKFLTSFRAAIKKRNYAALYAMTSKQFWGNCAGREVEHRDQFLRDNDMLNHFLEIFTPGSNPYFASTLKPIEQAKDGTNEESRIAVREAAFEQCFSLYFEYRADSGWKLASYSRLCEGC